MCRAVAVRNNAAGKGRGITAGRAHLMPYTAMSSLISIAVETSGSCSAGEVPVRCRFGFSGGGVPASAHALAPLAVLVHARAAAAVPVRALGALAHHARATRRHAAESRPAS